MHPIIRNILGVIIGIVAGSILNMSIIKLSSSIIPAPEGAITNTTEGLKASIHLFEPKHFIMPFLAHALGTLFGATIAAIIAKTNKVKLAMVIGVIFLIGGIMMVFMLPSPTWFSIVDLVFAYLPMAYIGAKFAVNIQNKSRK